MPNHTVYERFSGRKKRATDGSVANLTEKQWFHPPELLEPKHVLGESLPLIDKNTAIGSIGSCFAREIKEYLQRNEYNYLHYGSGRMASHGSAAWERVFNTACICQEIGRAIKKTPREYLIGRDGKYYDLGRKNAVFSTKEEVDEEQEEYIKCASAVIEECEVFIITLGLSEVWVDQETGFVLAEAPPQSVYDEERHHFRLLSPQENIENLRSAVTEILSVNPKARIVLTVSPVPLRATFFDRSALVSNNVSKASLICAAHYVSTEYEAVLYFPSYEITQYFVEDPFDWDGRHVTSAAVGMIMSMFMKKFSQI